METVSSSNLMYRSNSCLESDSLKIFIKKKQEEDEKNGALSSKKKHTTAQQNVAETIENNIRRKIVEKSPVNPKYYQKMSELFQSLIDERKEEVASYKEMLEKFSRMDKNVITRNVLDFVADFENITVNKNKAFLMKNFQQFAEKCK